MSEYMGIYDFKIGVVFRHITSGRLYEVIDDDLIYVESFQNYFVLVKQLSNESIGKWYVNCQDSIFVRYSVPEGCLP